MRSVTARTLSTLWARSGGYQAWVTFVLVSLGPVLVIATFLVLGALVGNASSAALRTVILIDLVYAITVAALVMQRVAHMIAARRARSAGSRLHLKLTGLFALIALVPTVLVAVFATISVNFGLEGWFSDRVQRVLGSSLAAAQAYEEEKRVNLAEDATTIAGVLNEARRDAEFLSDGELRLLLNQAQAAVQRGLREAYIIDGAGDLRVRGERSYLFDFEKPTVEQIAAARVDGPVIIEDWQNSEYRALMALEGYLDRYLYVAREVDGQILNLLDETQETVGLYNQLESDRGRLLFEFGLLYLGFAVILILAAIWFGLWFAERLSRPVGRLAGAAQRVGAGDFSAKVPISQGDDEIAMLGRSFNQMTTQLQGQRDALLENTQQIEERRRLFDSVLSSVTSGVIGLDSQGCVDFLNRSARTMLDLSAAPVEGQLLAEIAPEFDALFRKLQTIRRDVAQEELRLTRRGKTETLLVRMARRLNAEGQGEGIVVVFDDVTDLVSAQRMAAWGDVARRIAHEIKNPLTPIQLSAERLKRKFGPMVGDQEEALADLTGVIVRQTGDLRRIVDEFSKFARMPEPERRMIDIAQLVREAVLLQRAGMVDVKITESIPEGPVRVELDATMLHQALTNLIKNAGEAIETRALKGDPAAEPEIRVTLKLRDGFLDLSIADNGIGLPADTAKLFEPYVTTRDKGTGLGLPIVKKIIEEHDGTLRLVPAPRFGNDPHIGAQAIITLPMPLVPQNSPSSPMSTLAKTEFLPHE